MSDVRLVELDHRNNVVALGYPEVDAMGRVAWSVPQVVQCLIGFPTLECPDELCTVFRTRHAHGVRKPHARQVLRVRKDRDEEDRDEG